MNRLAIAGLVAGVLAITTPFASAGDEPPYYTYALPQSGDTFDGGCGFWATSDPTDGLLGGQSTHTGVAFMDVTPVDPLTRRPTGSDVTARCELFVNGARQGIVLGPTAGTGHVNDEARLTYAAARTDVVTLCTHVKSDRNSDEVVCVDAGSSPFIPPQVEGPLDLAGETLCVVLKALAPYADVYTDFPPPVVWIDPAEGDLSVAGVVVYDCPTHLPL